jgi:outer membrane protein TolC
MTRKVFFILPLLLPGIVPGSLPGFQGNLTEAISRALERNPEIQALELKVQAEGSRIKESFSSFLPRLQLEGNYFLKEKGYPITTLIPSGSFGNNLPPTPLSLSFTSDRFTFDYTLGLRIFQPIFAGGEIRAGYSLSQANYRKAVLNLQRKKEEFILKIIQAYLQVLLFRKGVELFRSHLELAQQDLQVVRTQKEQGKATDLDEMRAELDLEQAESRLLEMESSSHLSELLLKDLLGIPSEEELVLMAVEPPPPYPCSLTECLDLARKNRKDIQELIEESELLTERKRIVSSGHLPHLGLSGQGQLLTNKREDQIFSPPQTPWVTAYSVILTVSFPLFEGFGRRAQEEAIAQEVEAVKRRSVSLIQAVEREVRESYEKRELARKFDEVVRKKLEMSRKLFQVSETRFRLGLITPQQRREAEERVRESEWEALRARYDMIEKEFLFRKAIGILGREGTAPQGSAVP